MKPMIIKYCILLGALLCVPMLAEGDSLIDLPPSGVDRSTLRCEDGIIRVGDHPRDVFERCGQPVDRGKMIHRKHDIWVYHESGDRFVYYLAFMNRRLQRIQMVSCIKNDPYCD
jgi:hypothetical protein